MYPNPLNRKHSAFRQIIDRFLLPDLNNNEKNKIMDKFKSAFIKKSKTNMHKMKSEKSMCASK